MNLQRNAQTMNFIWAGFLDGIGMLDGAAQQMLNLETHWQW